PDLLEHSKFSRGGRFKPGRAGSDRTMCAINCPGDGIPLPAKGSLGVARLSYVAVGKHLRDSRPRTRAAGDRMLFALQHQKRTHGRERDAALRTAVPNRCKLVFQHHSAELK